jgi:Ca-activated chloride channel family protein
MVGLELEYPLWLLLPLLYLVCLKFCKKSSQSIYFSGFRLLKKAVKKSNLVQKSLYFMVVALFALALATPLKKSDIEIKDDKGYEIALIMDASGSMRKFNKFGITKDIVQEFLKQRVHDKIGLTIFADFAYVAVPLTYDKNSMIRLLKRVDVGVAGVRKTALYEALFLSANLFKDSKSKNKVAILLTDGMDNTDSIPMDVALKTVKKYGIKVYTIGIGNTGDYDPNVLEHIAKVSNGKFFQAQSTEALKRIYKTIDKLEKSKIKAKKYVKKKYYMQYPLAAAILLLLALVLYRFKGVKNGI